VSSLKQHTAAPINLTARSLGLSPDFALVNPIGFFALTIYTWGLYFSPVARRQYAERHDGHLPQVSKSDLAFALHASLLSAATLVQATWYFYRARKARSGKPVPASLESDPLLPRDADHDLADAPTAPSLPTRVALAVMGLATIYQLTSLSLGRTLFLDFLYFASSIKLLVSGLTVAAADICRSHSSSTSRRCTSTTSSSLCAGLPSRLFSWYVSKCGFAIGWRGRKPSPLARSSVTLFSG